MTRTVALVSALALSCGVSTGTTQDPILIASGPTASEVLAQASVLVGADRRPLDCTPFVGTPAGILLCSLLVTCSLPLDEQAVFGGIAFPGDVGIAPGWATSCITRSQRQAVTACVLANLSLDGVLGVASLRGVGLEVSPDELAIWTSEEGAFYGDLMAPEPVTAACRGVGPSVRQERACAQPDPSRPGLTRCGLTFAGACSGACGEPLGPYRRCRVGRREFSRIVTAFVEP